MENIKRPSGKETDDDLIKEQELFLKKKIKPVVNITRKYEKDNILKEEQMNDETPTGRDDLGMYFIQERKVVFDVQERDVSLSEPFVFKPSTISSCDVSSIFKKKIKQSEFRAKKNSQCIFAQLLEKTDSAGKEASFSNSSLTCSIVDGSGLSSDKQDIELKKIHEENLAKISTMSKEEIFHHQNQLKKYLDPSIIKFIQNKSNKRKDTTLSFTTNKESSDKILRKEGKDDCDALILEKALESEKNNSIIEEIPDQSSHVKNKNIDIPLETKELLECSNKGKWRNMNKIEKEKLEWMSNLPKANPINLKTGFTARFDFEGKLLAHDLETPTHKGLHHHGKEPEVAGYSLEELFLLARSTLQSQRITALHTIAHILENYWYGMMDGCFDNPLLPMILEAGIVPLLRWALDDTSVTSVAATVSAIHNLLISKSDEICLQRTFCWLNGHLIPHLEPEDLIEPNVVLEELTDADLIKLDVIKAFLRMDILPRFLYILQVLQPPPLVCKLIIDICARLAQHSVESANQMISHSKLLDLIFEKFLPLKWQYVDICRSPDTVNFSCPLPAAMKFIRIVISSDREFASYMISHYDLISIIMVYLTLQPNDQKVTFQDIQELMIESLKTFQVLLCYGLAYDVFLELFPIFVKQMEFCLSLDLNLDRTKHKQDFEYATHLLKTLEAIAVISVKDLGNSSSLAMNTIFNKAVTCLKKWLWQLSQEKCHDHGIALLAANVNLVSTCYEKCHEGFVCEIWEHCSGVKEVFNSYFVPCIKSQIFESLLGKLKSCSLLLNSCKSGNMRDSKTLISVGSILWKSDIVPVLQENSPIPLLLAFLRFCILLKELFNDTDNLPLKEFIQNESVIEYLKSINDGRLNASNWFSKFESHMIIQILKLASMVVSSDYSFWYKGAISILPNLKTPQEYLVEDVFETIVFNPTFVISNNEEIHTEIRNKLPFIAKCYTTFLLNSDALSLSKKLFLRSADVTTIAFLSTSQFLLSKDWCYQPVVKEYYNSKQSEKNNDLTSKNNSLLTSNLEWIYLCHDLHLPLLNGIPGAVEFCYLCMFYLLDGDFCYTPDVKQLLKNCLLALLNYKKIKLTKVKWENINEFDDLYSEMLNQFEAVSYGDLLFGNFILFPLQQCYSSRWKKVLFNDYPQVLQFLRVPFSELLIPLQNYLEPFETDIDVLLDYCKFLIIGTLTHVRCPVLYLMAIHHINHFIFAKHDEPTQLQRRLLSAVLQSKNKIVRHQILLYSEVDVKSEFGFSVYQELLPADQKHLSDIIGCPVNV
ncbi:RNA polymerase II-associated protein 1 [Trichonephila inaurata madagascariensis]|uniref:RNA polymerase II-associated protein 1 n=1 Tax=Trichonephila inaurata madagascariensis TaxID=2747483 RepID=A0A8X6MAW6_9ARAC|nr:RNA polymerase II-associated protein 1 [Trichonephila inaurata madagascariensis]